MFEHLFEIACGVGVAVLSWAVRKLLHLDKHAVLRSEFTQTIEKWHEERVIMHKENRETLERIHERVDDLWKRP